MQLAVHRIGWQEAYSEYRSYRVDMSEVTLTKYLYVVNLLRSKSPNDLRLIGRVHILTLLQKYSNAGTYNAALSAIKSFFEFCSEFYNIPNPAVKLHLKKESVLRITRCVTQEEYRTIFKHTGKARDSAVFIANTGLRVSELCSLRPEHIDFDRRFLRILGKGGKIRAVPLNTTAIELLRKYHPIYFSKSTWTIRNALAQLSKTLKLPKINPHSLRGCFATALLDRGANLSQVSLILGHSSVQTTVRYYYKPDDLHSAVSLLEPPELPESG